MPRCLVVFALELAIAAAISAAEPPAERAGDPAATVRAFHQALAAGDREAAVALLSPQVVIFEAGGAELSRAEYESHHLDADIDFLRATRTEVLHQQSGTFGEVAWILTQTRTTGRFGDRDVNTSGAETMLLQRSASGWVIGHIHWSSRPGKKPE